jgi:hypothetical protein
MLAPPIGFIPLRVALDIIRAKLPPKADAKREIAEACHGGKLKAAYRTWDGGADDLDPKIWWRQRWREFFEQGTVDLELPLIDDSGRPMPDGHTGKWFTAKGCTREVFITSDSLATFLTEIPPLPPIDSPKAKRGPKAGTLNRVVAEMQQDLMVGKITVDGLRAEPEKALAARYGGVSRDTARKARIRAISGSVSKPPPK